MLFQTRWFDTNEEVLTKVPNNEEQGIRNKYCRVNFQSRNQGKAIQKKRYRDLRIRLQKYE